MVAVKTGPMSILGKVFGENASGENSLSIFGRHVWMAGRMECSRSQLWEVLFVAGLGAVLGSFLGAGAAFGLSHLGNKKQEPPAQEINLATRGPAPGVIPGAAAGAAGMFYYLYVHGVMTGALRDTRNQLVKKETPQEPKP